MVDIHLSVAEQLGSHGHQYTENRRLVVDGLVAAGGPITLPDLLDAVPALAQSSAYRSLSVMEEAGVVQRLVHGSEHAYFELAEPFTGHHHHLICDGCGNVSDVTLPAEVEVSIDHHFDVAAAAQGFVPNRHNIDIRGHCARCAV